MKRIVSAGFVLFALSGCSVYREATGTVLPETADWRQVATDGDRQRLRGWRKAWDEALPRARAANPRAVAAQPALFDPDQAQGDAMPPVGAYRCRTFKLGAKSAGLPEFSSYPWFECRITAEGPIHRFEKLDGSQRPTGLIFPDASYRTVFLGTLILGDESTPLRYGTDANRDMAGYVERIGDKRWRLVLPYPRFESTLDVIELVPAG